MERWPKNGEEGRSRSIFFFLIFATQPYNARYYDSLSGSFISADDVETNFNGQNAYSYVHGNPETAIDPTGHVQIQEYGAGGNNEEPSPTEAGGGGSEGDGGSIDWEHLFGDMWEHLFNPTGGAFGGAGVGGAVAAAALGAAVGFAVIIGITATRFSRTNDSGNWTEGQQRNIAFYLGQSIEMQRKEEEKGGVKKTTAAMSYIEAFDPTGKSVFHDETDMQYGENSRGIDLGNAFHAESRTRVPHPLWFGA